MDTTSKEISPNVFEISVGLEPKETDEYLERAYSMLLRATGRQAKEGQTPRDAIVEFVGQTNVDALLGEAVMQAVAPFIVDDTYETVVAPQCVSDDKVQAGSAFHFKATLHTKPEHKLSSFEPVEVTVPSAEVSEDEMKRQEAWIVQQSATEKDGKKVIPALSDAWVKQNVKGCSTVPEFEALLLSDMRAQRKHDVEQDVVMMCCDALAERLEADISDEVVELNTQEFANAFETGLLREGHTIDEYLDINGITAEQLKSLEKDQALRQLKQGLALDALADHLQIKATQEDYDEFFKTLSPGKEVEAQNSYENEGRMFLVRESVRRTRARHWLRENAKLTPAE